MKKTDTGPSEKNRAGSLFKLLIISLLLLLFSTVLSLALGSRPVTIEDIIQGLTGHPEASLGATVVSGRIARTLFALIAGAALGISGALMQAITRNPIADPSVLGVNTGASLFVIMGIAFMGISTATEYIALALIGSALTAIFVYAIASIGRGGASPIKLALAGTATSASLSSLVSAIMLPRGQVMDAFRFWHIGSVGAASFESIGLVLPFLITGLLIAILSAPSLNALALGDDVAVGLGVNTKLVRLSGAAAGVMLCGAVTALAGPIGFIGLMAPHSMRLLLGGNQKILIPMSAVAGASILTISDIIGRLLGNPGELEVGVVASFIGAPLLVYIAMKSKVRTI